MLRFCTCSEHLQPQSEQPNLSSEAFDRPVRPSAEAMASLRLMPIGRHEPDEVNNFINPYKLIKGNGIKL